MVTDIHDWSIADADQPHLVFSMQQAYIAIDDHTADFDDHNHDSHCGVCRYDHGGHMGQMMVALSYIVPERKPYFPSRKILAIYF